MPSPTRSTTRFEAVKPMGGLKEAVAVGVESAERETEADGVASVEREAVAVEELDEVEEEVALDDACAESGGISGREGRKG